MRVRKAPSLHLSCSLSMSSWSDCSDERRHRNTLWRPPLPKLEQINCPRRSRHQLLLFPTKQTGDGHAREFRGVWFTRNIFGRSTVHNESIRFPNGSPQECSPPVSNKSTTRPTHPSLLRSQVRDHPVTDIRKLEDNFPPPSAGWSSDKGRSHYNNNTIHACGHRATQARHEPAPIVH